jgi:glycosyltransferase involved in cell wall biosynthesis
VPPDELLRLAFLGDPNSIHTRRWLTFFADRGHEVHLLEGFGTAIAPGLDERIRIDRYRAHARLNLPILSSLRSRHQLRRLLHRVRPHILHAHFVRRHGWQAALAGFHPYVVSPWGSDLLKVRRHSWRTRWWNRRALRGADLVTVSSEHMRAAAIGAGAEPMRIELVQHGVDTRLFAPGPPDRALVARLDVADRVVIFSPRALRPLYRHETIIDAFAKLPNEPVLLMSGAGASAAYVASLRERMRDRGVADRVRLVDAIPHDEMPAYLRIASMVVSMPESDSFPVTLLEAMSCGVPVIATDLPPAHAVLEPIDPASLVPVGEVGGLATAMRRTLALSDIERRQLGEALRRHVVRAADYEANMSRMEALYRRLVRRT